MLMFQCAVGLIGPSMLKKLDSVLYRTYHNRKNTIDFEILMNL
jgi:hypothetical protein